MKMLSFPRVNIIFITSLISFGALAFNNLEDKILSFQLLDEKNKTISFKAVADKKHFDVLALISISTGCPMVQKSFIKYEKLRKKWQAKRVKFIYLDSSPGFNISHSVAEVKKYNSTLQIYFDDSQALTKELGFESTNQILLLDLKKLEILYLGAVDSSLNYYTQKNDNIEFTDLALESFFSHRKISPNKTEAFGCAITFKTK